MLTPRRGLPFTLLWSLPSCPSSHPSCILCPSVALGHLGMCSAPISVFPDCGRGKENRWDRTRAGAAAKGPCHPSGQSQEGWPSLVFPSFFSCPGPVLGSLLPFLQPCSAPRIPQLSPFAQSVQLASLPFTLPAYLWGLRTQLTLVTPTPLPLPKSPALSRCLLQPPLHFFCSFSPSLDLPPLPQQP